MNPTLPEEAQDLHASACKAFAALGGVDVARRAEEDPAVRATEVAPLLAELGVEDLEPRDGDIALAAAAALCDAAGRVALPYPLAAALVRDADGRPTVVAPEQVWRVDHGDLFAQWRVGTLAGGGGVALGADTVLGTRLGPFVGALLPTEDVRPPDTLDTLLQMTLVAWGVLGTLERAVELAVEHVRDRVQFGKALAEFQSVQFQLADAAVAVAGLRELAAFTLWRLDVAGEAARVDVLALRLHSLDVARPVLRTAQQLHGAAGVCDEYDVSVLTRAVQPALRLPCSAERTADELAAAVATDGFTGLFRHGGTTS